MKFRFKFSSKVICGISGAVFGILTCSLFEKFFFDSQALESGGMEAIANLDIKRSAVPLSESDRAVTFTPKRQEKTALPPSNIDESLASINTKNVAEILRRSFSFAERLARKSEVTRPRRAASKVV